MFVTYPLTLSSLYADIAKMRKELEEEIRAQMAANQEALAQTEASTWEKRVRKIRKFDML